MPVKVSKGGGSCEDSQYAVVDDSGKTHGCHSTKNKAERQMRAINASLSESAATAEGTVLLDESGRADLSEARGSGTATIKVIAPGWGSSGYYSEAVLRRDGPAAFVAGTQMYLDHPARSEAVERPERSVRDLAGKLVSDATWQENGAAGPGLYAQAQVYSVWRGVLSEMAEDIGVSIRGYGHSEIGEAEGRTGPIVQSIDQVESVDFVTRAGAGGRILSLIESARAARDGFSEAPESTELTEARTLGQWLESRIHLSFTMLADDLYGDGYVTRDERMALSGAIGDALDVWTEAAEVYAPGIYQRERWQQAEPRDEFEESTMAMTDEERQALEEAREAAEAARREAAEAREQISTLTTERNEAQAQVQRFREAQMIAAARDHALGHESLRRLPDVTRARVAESVARRASAGEDGELDTTALDEAITAEATAETAYLEQVTGRSLNLGESVQSRGEETGGGEDETYEDDLKEAFGRLGLHDTALSEAVRGR